MDVLTEIRPVNTYSPKATSAAAVSKPLGKSSPPGNPEKHEIKRLRQVKTDTAQSIADGIKNLLTSIDVRLEFSIDKNTGDIMVRIIRNNSDQIIREIPEGGVILSDIGTIDETV